MAVDYFHRLLVSGPREDVRSFRHDIHREYPRTIERKTWTEIVPFSFAALYELAPLARRVENEIPPDPYDLSAWPERPIDKRRSMVRYQLHTRNLELVSLLRPLARVLPKLTFTLVTLCLDDSSIESYRLKGPKMSKWVLPVKRRDFHWDRARTKFGLQGDDVFDDDEADHWAEQEMLEDALNHWQRGTDRIRRVRRYQWWNVLPLRDWETERSLSLLMLTAQLAEEAKRKPRRRKVKR